MCGPVDRGTYSLACAHVTCGHVALWTYRCVDNAGCGHVGMWTQGDLDVWTCVICGRVGT